MHKITESIKCFLDECYTLKAYNTAKAYQYQLNTVIKYFNQVGLKHLEEINKEHIINMINHFRKTCKNITINKRIRLLKEISRYFNIKNDELYSIKKLKVSKVHYDCFAESELKMIMKYINNLDSNNPYELTRMVIILLLIETGVRQSELLNIKIKHIDIENMTIKLTSTKTKTEGYVFFTYMTRTLLKEYIEFFPDREYLLFNYMSYNRYNYRHLNSFMEHLRKNLGLKHCHAHMFRHTMATMLLENGCPLDSVQKLLRHRDLSTTQIYLHMSVKKTKSDYQKYAVLPNL